MPRKVIDSCMFCFGDGCEACTKPAKKSAAKPRTPRPIVDVELPEVIDVKAAMKAVANTRAKEDEDDRVEFLEALVAIEPILHPDERIRVSAELDAYLSPADRWKRRNGDTR